MLKIINDRDIMGEHVNGPVYNIVTWGITVLLIIMTVLLLLTTVFPGLFG
jgi:Mn2+/Fe2+ NRAMP family transporter